MPPLHLDALKGAVPISGAGDWSTRRWQPRKQKTQHRQETSKAHRRRRAARGRPPTRDAAWAEAEVDRARAAAVARTEPRCHVALVVLPRLARRQRRRRRRGRRRAASAGGPSAVGLPATVAATPCTKFWQRRAAQGQVGVGELGSEAALVRARREVNGGLARLDLPRKGGRRRVEGALVVLAEEIRHRAAVLLEGLLRAVDARLPWPRADVIPAAHVEYGVVGWLRPIVVPEAAAVGRGEVRLLCQAHCVHGIGQLDRDVAADHRPAHIRVLRDDVSVFARRRRFPRVLHEALGRVLLGRLLVPSRHIDRHKDADIAVFNARGNDRDRHRLTSRHGARGDGDDTVVEPIARDALVAIVKMLGVDDERLADLVMVVLIVRVAMVSERIDDLRSWCVTWQPAAVAGLGVAVLW
eukprot:scaffold13557_cov63-Phaeocystis_antarctica.AAC.2